MTAAAKLPRFADLPAGTPVQIELDPTEYPNDDGSVSARVVRHGEFARAYRNKYGEWVCILKGSPDEYLLERMRPRRGHMPRKPSKNAKQPTIPIVELAQLAREAFGDEFVRIEQRDRIGRSETITLYIRNRGATDKQAPKGYTNTLKYAHDRPKGDPDAVRKHVRDNLLGVIAKHKTREIRV